jgi:hypothetical protein
MQNANTFPKIQAITLDMAFQITQVSNRAAIHAIEPTGRNRVNTAFMLCTFTGQLTGTSAGARLYARGGWVASGSLSVGLMGFALVACALRGPYEKGWIGWSGGWNVWKTNLATATKGNTPVEPQPQPVALEVSELRDDGKEKR